MEKNEVYKLLLVAYFVGLISQTLMPTMQLGIDGTTGWLYIDVHIPRKELRSLNIVPFKTILTDLTGNNPLLGEKDRVTASVLTLFGNTLLYIPIGLLLSFMRTKGRGLGFVLLISLIISCVIEILQYIIGRTADIDDVLLHLLGTSIGYGLHLMLCGLKVNRLMMRQR